MTYFHSVFYRNEIIKDVIQKTFSYIADRKDLEINADFLSFQPLPCSAIDRPYFEQIQPAILSRNQLNMLYHSRYRNERTQRLVDPYLLHNHFTNWYLVGHCQLRDEVRIFALNRIMTIETTKNSFEMPQDFSIEKMLNHSFNLICGVKAYQVMLKFRPYEARRIRERQWHCTQNLTELDDGGLIMEMEVQGLDNVKRWIMQFGAEVEVLQLMLLREKIINELENMSLLYK